MAITRRQVFTVLSIIYLLALTSIAAYALHLSNAFSLPIANVVPALTVALPPLTGIALESLLNRRAERLPSSTGASTSSSILPLVIGFFLVYDAVLATLAGIHLAPAGSLTCALHERWQTLYSARDAAALTRIQDAFRCCGFNSVMNMAFPFKDRMHGDDACVVRYERDTACVGSWRGEERKVAVLLLVVPLAVFAWKVVVILASSAGDSSSSWLPSAIWLPNDSEAARTRPAIAYRDVEDAEDSEEVDSLGAEVATLNRHSSLASHVEGVRVRPSPLRQPREEGDRARRIDGANNVWARADEAGL